MNWGNHLDKAANLCYMFDMLTDADQVRFLDFLHRAEVQAFGEIDALAPKHFYQFGGQWGSRSNVICIDTWQVSGTRGRWGSGEWRRLNLIGLLGVLNAGQQKALLDFTYCRMVQAFGRRAEFVPVSTPAHCRGWKAEKSNVIEITTTK